MTNPIQVEVRGLEKVDAGLRKLGRSLDKYMQDAAVQASKSGLDTEGLRKYPPSTAANQPPTPFYIRGRGMQYKSRNDGRSEKLGTRWHVEKVGYGAKIYNNASYAQYVHGENQAAHMARIGWKKLLDVFTERIPKIKKTFDAWVKKAIKDAGL